MAVAITKSEVDFSIKPESVTRAIPTSEWPLLLKNYDKRTVYPAKAMPLAVRAEDFGPSKTDDSQFLSGPAILLPSPAAALHSNATSNPTSALV